MRPKIRLAGFALLVAVVAAGTCYLSSRVFEHRKIADAVAYHYWVHERLGLSAEQGKALEPIEAKFAERRNKLLEAIRSANRELAEAIRADLSNSSRVNAAVEKIHRAQGELQTAVLEHIFDMRPVLSREQYERLIKLTAEALEAESE